MARNLEVETELEEIPEEPCPICGTLPCSCPEEPEKHESDVFRGFSSREPKRSKSIP